MTQHKNWSDVGFLPKIYFWRCLQISA